MKQYRNRLLVIFGALSIGLHAVVFFFFAPGAETPQQLAMPEVSIKVALQKPDTAKPVKTTSVKPTTAVPVIGPSKPDKNQAASDKPVNMKPTNALLRQAQAEASLEATTNHKSMSELQRLLHTAIDRYKFYPLSARRLRQEGTARVAFRLFVDGRIESLNIIHTSGYHSLDNAALSAVQRIQPFTPAKQYLASPEDFKVDVMFRL